MTIAKLTQKQVKILNIRIDGITKGRLLTTIGNLLANGKKFNVVTPNPEMILQAQTDRNLALAIDRATFSLADGIGLKMFADNTLEIIHGRKLVLDLLKLANKKGLKAFFVTSDQKNTNQKLLAKIEREYPQIAVQSEVGPRLTSGALPTNSQETEKQAQLIIKINTFKPDLLFVSMSTPKQEIWVDIHREELNAIGVFCVGAGLDFYAGTAKAPHRWMEKLEIEWLWRLLTEPKRFKRILNAVVVFPLTLLLNRFKKN